MILVAALHVENQDPCLAQPPIAAATLLRTYADSPSALDWRKIARPLSWKPSASAKVQGSTQHPGQVPGTVSWFAEATPRRYADLYVLAHHPVTDETADHRDPCQGGVARRPDDASADDAICLSRGGVEPGSADCLRRASRR